MKGKVRRVILGIYDLFLAIGAIYYGSKMALGLFWAGEEWPKEWIGRVPFESWFWPGVIAIVIFGLGNLFAAYYSIYKEEKFYLPSLVIGLIFLISLIISIPVLGETYLATGMFIILSMIQLILTLISLIRLKKQS